MNIHIVNKLGMVYTISSFVCLFISFVGWLLLVLVLVFFLFVCFYFAADGTCSVFNNFHLRNNEFEKNRPSLAFINWELIIDKARLPCTK